MKIINFDIKNKKIKSMYDGEIVKDHYGREVPKSSHGSIRINHKTASIKIITKYLLELFEKIINPLLLVRRINIAVCNLDTLENVKKDKRYEQLDLFSDNDEIDKKNKDELVDEENELKVEKVLLNIKQKYGKNSILKAMDLEEKATTIMRNNQIGGHKC